MKKTSFYSWGLIFAAFIFVGASCSNPYAASDANQSPNVDSQPVGANAVVISNFAFVPASLIVKAGDTVTWTNNDSVSHTVKSALFQSPKLSPGQSFQYTFSQAGTIDYSCGIHPTMKAQIIVQP